MQDQLKGGAQQAEVTPQEDALIRFIIYGAGAIGSLFGAYLVRAGRKAILIGREAHANKVVQDGLKVKTTGGSFVVSLPAITEPSDIDYGEGDTVFLTTKSQDTEEAAAALAKCAPRDIPLFCFQNGVRNEEIVSRRFTNVYGGVVFFSGTYLAPGEVVHTRVDRVGLGVYPSGLNETARAVCEALKGAGFLAFTHRSIMAVKWSKLVINLGMAVNAATGLSGTEGMAFKESRELIADITEEGVRVILAAGITLEDEPGRPSPAEHPARLRAMSDIIPDLSIPEEMKHRPSPWQDLTLRRGETEIDFLNGEIVRLGKKMKMPAPLNSFFVKLVKKMAQEGERPGTYSVADLRRLLATEGHGSSTIVQ